MKFNVAYVKQHPAMFGAIVIVFGLLFWLLINRNSGGASASSGGTTVVSSGPSDAAIAAGAQVQLAQIAAASQGGLAQLQYAAQQDQNQAQYAIATMEMQYQMADLAASHDIQGATIAASLEALNAQLNNALETTQSNNAFALDYARVAADSATTQLAIGAALQRDLGAQQLEAFKTSSVLSIIPSLKKKNRDETLQILGSVALGGNASYSNSPFGTYVSGGGPAVIPAASLVSAGTPKPAQSTSGQFIGQA